MPDSAAQRAAGGGRRGRGADGPALDSARGGRQAPHRPPIPANELDRRQVARYAGRVAIVAFFRRLLRKLQPPGNRSSLETEYLQPNAPVISGGPNPPSGHVPGGYMQN